VIGQQRPAVLRVRDDDVIGRVQRVRQGEGCAVLAPGKLALGPREVEEAGRAALPRFVRPDARRPLHTMELLQ
jgi:hypothetical protein